MSENNSQLPQLCLDCKAFFGNPAYENLCSTCFKKVQKLQRKQQMNDDKSKDDQEEEAAIPRKLLEFRKTQISADKIEVKLEKAQTQLDVQVKKLSGKCICCSKKVGMLGYECRHCSNTFCKLHRLPEDHECGVDFISLGRKKLKMENPTIQKPKIEKL